jgi:hypothetical protein
MSGEPEKAEEEAADTKGEKLVRLGLNVGLPAAGTALGDTFAPGTGGLVGSTLGGLIAGGLDAFVPHIMRKRDQQFREAVHQGLVAMQQANSSLTLTDEAIQDKVTTALLLALPAALRTTKEEKLRALRNAVLNASLPSAPDEDMIAVYMTLIDSATVLHLRFLKYLADPDAYYSSRGIVRPQEQDLPWSPEAGRSEAELEESLKRYNAAGQTRYQLHIAEFNKLFDTAEYPLEFCNKVLQDLFTWNLLNPDVQSTASPMDVSDLPYYTPTYIVLQYGRRFLEFISDPAIFPTTE